MYQCCTFPLHTIGDNNNNNNNNIRTLVKRTVSGKSHSNALAQSEWRRLFHITHLTQSVFVCPHNVNFPISSWFYSTKMYKHLNTHSVFESLVLVAVSTRHSWLWQTWDDVYTRRCFSESEGTRFSVPGQKALPSMNEFTLLLIFA